MGDDYERSRPSYPAEAVHWIVGPESRRVLDLGCGPGKLTARLAELGHRVVGVDPAMTMLRAMPGGLPAICGAAEAIPLRGGSVEAVTVAQAFHWFDHGRALPEIHRVLSPTGRVGLLWNLRDASVEWVRKLSNIVGSEDAMAATLGEAGAKGRDVLASTLQRSELFDPVEREVFSFSQELDQEGLLDLVRSRSYVAILPEPKRREILDEVAELCSRHPQLEGGGRINLPYKTVAFRASVAGRALT
jgi:SAM-dependent methyltransferase